MMKNKNLYIKIGLFVILILGIIFIPIGYNNAVTGSTVYLQEAIGAQKVNYQPLGYEAFSDSTELCGSSINDYEALGSSITSSQQGVLDILKTLQTTQIDCEHGFFGMVSSKCEMEYVYNIWDGCQDEEIPGYEGSFHASRKNSGYKVAYMPEDVEPIVLLPTVFN